MNDRMSARKSGQQHVFVEAQLLDLPLERGPEVSFAKDHEPRVGYLAHDERRRIDQVLVALFLGQRRNRADDRRLRRQPELGMNVRRGLSLHAMEIDPFVDGDDPIGIDPIADQHVLDRA